MQAAAGRSNAITSGHRACQGCGEALGARYVLDAAMRGAEGRLIAANATGCLEVFSTPYPESAWQVPWVHSLFANAASVAMTESASACLRPCNAWIFSSTDPNVTKRYAVTGFV